MERLVVVPSIPELVSVEAAVTEAGIGMSVELATIETESSVVDCPVGEVQVNGLVAAGLETGEAFVAGKEVLPRFEVELVSVVAVVVGDTSCIANQDE